MFLILAIIFLSTQLVGFLLLFDNNGEEPSVSSKSEHDQERFENIDSNQLVDKLDHKPNSLGVL
jgi:hypothetical protein